MVFIITNTENCFHLVLVFFCGNYDTSASPHFRWDGGGGGYQNAIRKIVSKCKLLESSDREDLKSGFDVCFFHRQKNDFF